MSEPYRPTHSERLADLTSYLKTILGGVDAMPDIVFTTPPGSHLAPSRLTSELQLASVLEARVDRLASLVEVQAERLRKAGLPTGFYPETDHG